MRLLSSLSVIDEYLVVSLAIGTSVATNRTLLCLKVSVQDFLEGVLAVYRSCHTPNIEIFSLKHWPRCHHLLHLCMTVDHSGDLEMVNRTMRVGRRSFLTLILCNRDVDDLLRLKFGSQRGGRRRGLLHVIGDLALCHVIDRLIRCDVMG